jgi:hypothetical protein
MTLVALNMQHHCGEHFKMYTVENPPKIIVCPACKGVLALHGEKDGIHSYSVQRPYD